MKRILAVLASALAVLVMAGCSHVDTGPDEIGLHYKGGTGQDQKFDSCVPVSKNQYDGPGDKHYIYPVGQRTFSFNDDQNGAESAPISIVSSDLVEMTVEGLTTFNFTNDCAKIQKFHEQIGNKYRKQYGEEDNKWWNAILNDYVKQSLDKAMDASAKGITFRDLYANPDAKKAWEDSVARLTPQFINAQAGDTYFSDFRFNLQVPQPPASIKAGFTDRQAAVEQNEAQKARNEQIVTATEGIQAEIDKLGPEAWAQKYCIDKSAGQQGLPAGWNCFGGSTATITNR